MRWFLTLQALPAPARSSTCGTARRRWPTWASSTLAAKHPGARCGKQSRRKWPAAPCPCPLRMHTCSQPRHANWAPSPRRWLIVTAGTLFASGLGVFTALGNTSDESAY